MNIHYKIIEVWPNDHVVVARYWTDNISQEFLASDSNRNPDGTPVRCRTDTSFTLPVPEPLPEEIEARIANAAPVDFLKLMEQVIDSNIDTSLSKSSTLLNVQKTTTENDIAKLRFIQARELTDEDLDKLIK